MQMADSQGKMVEVEDLVVDGGRIYRFVNTAKVREVFGEHSLDWAVDHIITRGMKEIERTQDSKAKQKENAAFGSLREMNLTPEQAKRLILEAMALKAAAAKTATAE